MLLLLVLLAAPLLADDIPAPLLGATTLERDITTAGFYELVAWLEGLGLSTQGDRAALARRLYEHYGIQPTVSGEEEETALVVDSASRTRYFTLEDMDERYVRLTGGVTLTLRDDERGVTHRIVADEVTYNEDLDVLSASGNVVYTLDRQGTVEQFSGEALTVQLDSWEGAFVRGVTERSRTIEGEEVDFSFAGSYITRSADDVVVMEDGRVTSSRADPPNYEIRARKIWVLAPGEWGLRNASLYVGRVPVFYFPFFFRPGNELFFNPAVGVRDREGGFIQTTTYLRGRPEESDAVFSFLQIAEEGESRQNRRIEGLYLVPDDTADAGGPAGSAGPVPTDRSTLRLMADVYTKLGAYVALDGAFPQAGPLRNLEFFAGIAASRNLYSYGYAGGVSYSPYLVYQSYETGELAYLTDWNSTQVGSASIPFRYGAGFSSGLAGSGYSLAGDFTVYSDSRFPPDFDQRSEQIDWLGLVGQGTPVPQPAPVPSFEWALRGSVTPGLQKLRPWVQRADLQNVGISLRFLERSLTAPDGLPGRPIRDAALVAPADAAELEDYRIWLADSGPETRFYYPDRLQVPTISGLLSGQIFNLTSTAAPSAPPDQGEAPTNALRPPWSVPGTPVPSPAEPFRLPDTPGALPAPAVPQLWNASLGYNLTPTFVLEQTFDHDADVWAEPEDVDFSVSHSAATARLTGSFPLRAAVLGDLLSLNGSLSLTGQYRGLLTGFAERGESLSMDEYESLKHQGFTYTSANGASNATMSFRPFPASPLWSRSSVGYTLNLLLFQTQYEGPQPSDPDFLYDADRDDWVTTLIEWNDQYVRAHQLQLTAALGLNGGHSLRVAADLPPRTARVTGQLDLGFGPLSLSAGSGVQWDGAEFSGPYTWQPFASTQTLALGKLGQLQNQLSVEIEQDGSDPAHPSRVTGGTVGVNRTTASVGPVRGSFELRSSEGYTFNAPGSEEAAADGPGWQGDGDERLRPARAEVSTTLSRELEPMWRNRLFLGGSVQSGWSVNLLKPTESNFTFTLKAEVEVTDFLSLTFSSQSVNNQTYAYVGPWADRVGRDRESLVVDLAKSFNFFSRQDRIDSPFNLQQIRIDATHYLEDWDLVIAYSGRPEVVRVAIEPDTSPAYSVYEWQSNLEIALEWRAIRELKSTVGGSNRRSTATVESGTEPGTRPPSQWEVTIGDDS